MERSVKAALSSGNLIYALIILWRPNPAVCGQYAAGGWQEKEREAVMRDREPEEKGTLVREAVLEQKGHKESSQQNT